MSDVPQPPELTGIEAAAASVMEIRLRTELNEQDWDTIMQRVREAMASRQAMGREKYRMTLSDNQAPLQERVRHLWEEMLDGLAYSHWIWEDVAIKIQRWTESKEDEDASRTARRCMVRIIASLVDLDRVMRGLGMEPVKKGGSDV